jgi:broad specificity phosphatase PhoE
MAEKAVTLVVVRHGQATHNLDTFRPEQIVWTEEPKMPFMNSPLTEEGRVQAGLVARRLADTKFHLGLASDLARAWDTAQAIAGLNSSVGEVEPCRLLRERNAGMMEGDHELVLAQWTVENAVEDRELLSWRIPGGESVVDLRVRVRAFLALAGTRALALEMEHPVLLVATHYVFMHELYHVLAEEFGPHKRKPRTPNTGVDQYTLTVRPGEDGSPRLERVTFDLISCGRHLQDA